MRSLCPSCPFFFAEADGLEVLLLGLGQGLLDLLALGVLEFVELAGQFVLPRPVVGLNLVDRLDLFSLSPSFLNPAGEPLSFLSSALVLGLVLRRVLVLGESEADKARASGRRQGGESGPWSGSPGGTGE